MPVPESLAPKCCIESGESADFLIQQITHRSQVCL
jgi:hypothetical protein